MGYSIRNQAYHYIRWVRYNVSKEKAFLDELFAEELYVLKGSDADPFETVNRAGDANYSKAKQKMYAKLQKGWQKALPKDA